MPRASRSFWFVPALCLVLLAAAACGGGGGGEPESASAAAEPEPTSDPGTQEGGVDTYTVRGVIEQLPNPEREGSSLMVRHVPIPDFKNAKGEVVGMNAMTMPFPLADGVSLDGFEVGDKVELTFDVQYEPSTSFETTKITKLPGATELDFSGGGSHTSHE